MDMPRLEDVHNVISNEQWGWNEFKGNVNFHIS